MCAAQHALGRFVGHSPLCAKGSCELPPSLLCGCWAWPWGPVKQQDHSGLGERGPGESLNKEFLIWNSLGSVVHYSPPHSPSAPLAVASPPALPWGVAVGTHFRGLGFSCSLHIARCSSPGACPSLVSVSPVLAGAQQGLRVPHQLPRGRSCRGKWGAQREEKWLKGEPQTVQGLSRRVCSAQKHGGISHGWVSRDGHPLHGGAPLQGYPGARGQPRCPAPGRGVVAAGGAGRGGGVM